MKACQGHAKGCKGESTLIPVLPSLLLFQQHCPFQGWRHRPHRGNGQCSTILGGTSSASVSSSLGAKCFWSRSYHEANANEPQWHRWGRWYQDAEGMQQWTTNAKNSPKWGEKDRAELSDFAPKENGVNTEVFPAKCFEFNRTVFCTQNHCLETLFWPATLLVTAVGCSVLAHS